MRGDGMIYLCQTLGRIPGLGFMEKHANELLTKQLTLRSHKERALELKERGTDVGDAVGASGKDGEKKKGGKPSGKGGGGSQGRGGQTRGRPQGGPSHSGQSHADQSQGNQAFTAPSPGRPTRRGQPSQSEWGPETTDRGLRNNPPTNVDRLRNPDPDQPPQQDRLRRKDYDL